MTIAAVHKLHELAEQLRAGKVPPAADLAAELTAVAAAIGPQVAACLDDDEKDAIVTSDSADKLAARDILVQAMAAFYPGRKVRQQAALIEEAWARYFMTPWQHREAALDECPPRHAARVQALFWQALKLRPRPLRFETIRKILAANE